MKLKYLLTSLLCFAILPAFAEDFTGDIYEPDGTETPTYTENDSYSGKKNKYEEKTSKSTPVFEGEILTEYYIDTLTNSKNKIQKGDTMTNSYLYTEALMKLNIANGFFVETKLYLQPVNKRVYTGGFYAGNPDYIVGDALSDDFYGRNNYVKRRAVQFSSYGLGVETLYAGYKNSNLAVGLGKINPTFGSAFDRSRFSGVYGIALPEEYELTEKIGGYVSAIFPVGTLTFNTFFDDTTWLSSTIFKNRGIDRSRGGAGNTEKLNNFSLTFDGEINNLSFNAGFRYLQTDLQGEKAEKGLVLGAEYLFDLGHSVNFLPFAEVAYLNNFNGMKKRNVTYFTVFLPLVYQNWHFIASNTSKFDDEKGYHNYTSYLTQLSVGYKFDFGLMIDLAKIWERYAKKADDFTVVGPREKWVRHDDSWAIMVSYMFKF